LWVKKIQKEKLMKIEVVKMEVIEVGSFEDVSFEERIFFLTSLTSIFNFPIQNFSILSSLFLTSQF
jgi:hypothetical protein